MGERPIILQPDGDLTINYLDTGGMPLAQLQVATAVALLSRMIGEAPDAETQQVRYDPWPCQGHSQGGR